MRAGIALFALLSTMPATGSEMVCGTSPERTEWLRTLGAWSAARAQEVAAKGTPVPAAVQRGDVYVIEADEANAPFHRPFDLAGRTLVFRREGSTGFSVTNVPLEWDDELGTRVVLQPSVGESHAVVSLDFDFPFYDRTRRTVYVTGYNAIYFVPPRISEVRQYGDLDLAAEPQPVIAPLLSTQRSRLTPVPEVYVRKDADSAVVTWIAPDRYSVRASIDRSGEIRFSYHTVTTRPAAASIVITSALEPWRSRRAAIASKADPGGDSSAGVPIGLGAMLDITNASVARVDGLDLYEVRVRMRAAFDAEGIPSGDSVQVDARFGNQIARYVRYPGGRERYTLPVWGSIDTPAAVRIDNGEVVLSFLREHVTDSSAPLTVWTYWNGSRVDLTETLNVSFPETEKRVRTDFSLASQTLVDRPIAEAFTTPVLSVYQIWQQLKDSDPSLTDATVDGVAIYQNFFTDLVTFAGAYSTGGNAGVSGLFENDERWASGPRAPALMHMNALGYGHNSTSAGASRVVLHELGHRWLMFVSLLENGAATRKLNPASAHPAQYVDTRAAFNVVTETDTSVMGGGWFTDHGNGTFSTSAYGPYGYSWLDLYLMGLAAETEVPPMFYIDDSDPQLGKEYYAPANQTFSGTRRDFSLRQIVDATGPRHPAYPATQRNFRVVFVLIADPVRGAAEEDLEQIEQYRALMERDFPVATGGRGAVVTSLTPPPSGPRRRVAPK